MDDISCKVCGSSKVQSRGKRNGKKRYQCIDRNHPEGIGRYFSEGDEPTRTSSSYETGDNFINIVVSSPRILTEEQIIAQFEVDTNKWKVESFKVKTSEGYRKDKQIDWHVKDGQTTEGHSVDSGKMLVVPLFHIEVKFVRKTEEIRVRSEIDAMLDEIRDAPKTYPEINYALDFLTPDEGMMYEIDIPDIHFGRLTWAEESGEDYDIKIAYNAVHDVVDTLLTMVREFPISKIMLPFGNDFFNVNSKQNTTVHGTPQQEDTRWSKTFRKGRILAQEIIEKCVQIAPTEVITITGNHDEEKMFYLGELLAAKYEGHPKISVDNTSRTRKYRLHGVNLIGFAHGYNEKLYKLPSLMALEAPQEWAKSKFREFHTGDKHHKFDAEENGVVVRILRALAPADAWTFNSGFVGSVRAAEAFLWHPQKGLVAQYTAMP